MSVQLKTPDPQGDVWIVFHNWASRHVETLRKIGMSLEPARPEIMVREFLRSHPHWLHHHSNLLQRARRTLSAAVTGPHRTAARDRKEVTMATPTIDATTNAPLAQVVSDLSLTPRQTQITMMMGQGINREQIAADLGITLSTLRSHQRMLYLKLGVSNRAEMMALLIQRIQVMVGAAYRPGGLTHA